MAVVFARLLMRLVTPFKSITQLGSFPSSKSGAVFSHARVELRLRPFLLPFKVKAKRHVRDLGHEHSGPYARRLVECERTAAGVRRLPRLRRFRKSVGKKAAALSSAGLTPSWSHGHDGSAAQRSQVPAYGWGSATRFEQVTKSFDGICVGTHRQEHDPLFAATVTLAQEYATQLWDGRINPGLLVRAHKAWVDRRSSHGPLVAVIMSLRRIGWSLGKGLAIRSDTDEPIDVLQTPPRRVAALVEIGITRWQLRDAARSLALDPIEAPDIWLRHALHVVFAERSWSACEIQHVLLHGHGRPPMYQSDDVAEPPDRPVVLFLRLCTRCVCPPVARIPRDVSNCFSS